MFEFTKQLELVVRSVLNKKLICKYSGQDLMDVIKRKIRNNELIIRAWNVLSRSITSETLINSIKKQIITKWIVIRAKSFVNTFIKVLKSRINNHTSDGGFKLATTLQNALCVKPCTVEIEFQFQINPDKLSVLSFKNKVFRVAYVVVIIYFIICMTMPSVHIGIMLGVTILEFAILLFLLLS